jgi:diguanylate cyclase (GGDEF)-like protein/PAS domain S-box-containing protein
MSWQAGKHAAQTFRWHVQMGMMNSYQPTGFFDLLLDAVCAVDVDGRFVFVSAACERIFGYTPQEMIGRPMIDLVAPADRERTLAAALRIMAGDPQLHFENRYVRKDGELVTIMWTARWSEKDQLRIAVARDVTARRHAESVQIALYAISEATHAAQGLPDLCERIHRIIDGLLPARNFSVGLQDAGGELTFPYRLEEDDEQDAQFAPAARLIYAELLRTGQPLLLTPDTAAAFPAAVQALMAGDTLCWLAVPLSTQSGVTGAVFLKSVLALACYTERDKELLRFISTQIASAVERIRLYERLNHASQYDQLTDLPNRRLFYDRLENALARVRRSRGCMSLLYLDLDKFKEVNDTFGHAAGDALLQEIARRLKHCVRDSDTVARIGGDEFVVLLESAGTAVNAAAVAAKINEALSQPVQIGTQQMQVLPSIGIALYPEHGSSGEALLKHADEAMYRVKRGAVMPDAAVL